MNKGIQRSLFSSSCVLTAPLKHALSSEEWDKVWLLGTAFHVRVTHTNYTVTFEGSFDALSRLSIALDQNEEMKPIIHD